MGFSAENGGGPNNIWYSALYQEEPVDAYRCRAPFALQETSTWDAFGRSSDQISGDKKAPEALLNETLYNSGARQAAVRF